jgi:Fe-S cluster assembly protein SufD
MAIENIQDQILAELQAVSLNGSSETEYGRKRLSGAELFRTLGLPTPKQEDWKYSNLKGLSKNKYNFRAQSDFSAQDLSHLPFSSLSGVSLCFVNGQFNSQLSNFGENLGQVSVLTLADAEKQLGSLLDEHFAKYADVHTDGSIAANTALSHQGVVVFVPDHCVVESPIIIHSIIDTRTQAVGVMSRQLFVVGKNAEAKFVEVSTSLGELSGFTNLVSEVVVGQDARVDYYKIQDENDASFHIATTQVCQHQQSYFYAATVTLNGGFVRNNLNVVLDGQHIETHMYGLYIPNASQHVDNHTLVDHRKPNCESNELYKGVLMDKATGVFNGKIFVREDAQKTNAYQNCRNVITSADATMNTKPQLEIWADDVKCSHGTTTGQLNDEAIFYMQSRGIPKAEAIKLQLIAFAEDVVSKIKIDEIREKLEVLIAAKLA